VNPSEVFSDDADREHLAPEKIAMIDARNGKPDDSALHEVSNQHVEQDQDADERRRKADDARESQWQDTEARDHVRLWRISLRIV